MISKSVNKILWLVVFLFASCSVAKNIPENQFVINKVKIKVEGNTDISAAAFNKLIRTKPLRRTLFLPIHAWIYNIPNTKKASSREERKEKKLKKINDKRIDRYNKKTFKYLSKRNYYRKLYEKYLQAGDTVKAMEYYRIYKENDAIVKERQKDYSTKIEELKKKDVFMLSDIFYKLGEKPQIFDTADVIKSIEQIKIYLQRQGYFHSSVKVITEKKGKKINIAYVINPGRPHLIENVNYIFPNDTVKKILSRYPALKMKTNVPLAIKVFEDYRANLVNQLKDSGFYFFVKDFITFKIDTLQKPFSANVDVIFYNSPQQNKLIYSPWHIRNVYIFSDYNSIEALNNPDYYEALDTVPFVFGTKQYFFVRRYDFTVKPKRVANELYIYPNSLYAFSKVKKTYRHLSKFKIYKLVNIRFNPVDSTKHLLDCDIQLNPSKKKSLTIEFEGTNNSGNLGAAMNLKFTHKNLFKGGEILDLTTQAAIERQTFLTQNENLKSFGTKSFTINAKLTFPRLITVFKQSQFIERSNPKTLINLAYNYEDRPEYNRISTTMNFDYYWKSADFMSNYLSLFRVSYVDVKNMADFFRQWLENNYLKESYESHFIIGPKYNIILSNQGKPGNNYYVNINFSYSGIGVNYFLTYVLKDTTQSGKIFPGLNVPFSQFVKTDVDARYYFRFDRSDFVVRQFVGVGYPWGNSNLMPFGEQYFAGGANDIRAWQVRSLGPGSYQLPADIAYPNQVADIKIETNFEYRFKIIKFLEGAIFWDMGNIWSVHGDDYRQGADFRWDRFYKELAVGSGFGIRLNVQFIVLRTDLGIKLRDPAMPPGHNWIPLERFFTPSDFNFNFAIGYPF